MLNLGISRDQIEGTIKKKTTAACVQYNGLGMYVYRWYSIVSKGNSTVLHVIMKRLEHKYSEIDENTKN